MKIFIHKRIIFESQLCPSTMGSGGETQVVRHEKQTTEYLASFLSPLRQVPCNSCGLKLANSSSSCL